LYLCAVCPCPCGCCPIRALRACVFFGVSSVFLFGGSPFGRTPTAPAGATARERVRSSVPRAATAQNTEQKPTAGTRRMKSKLRSALGDERGARKEDLVAEEEEAVFCRRFQWRYFFFSVSSFCFFVLLLFSIPLLPSLRPRVLLPSLAPAEVCALELFLDDQCTREWRVPSCIRYPGSCSCPQHISGTPETSGGEPGATSNNPNAN